MRFIGAILLLLVAGILGGCPQPIVDKDAENGAAIGRDTARPDASAAVRESDSQTADAAVDSEGDAEPDDTDEAAAADTAMAARDADAPVDEDAPAPPEKAGAVTFPGQDRAQKKDAQDGPVGPPAAKPDEAPEDVLDPATMLGDAADKPVKQPKPTPALDAEARAFSGQWSVIVINQDGHSRLAQTDGEWIFELADDATCTVSRELNGVAGAQSGRWEYAAGELKLRLGPAHREYGVEQPREDVALFTDRSTNAVLFCLRLDTKKRAPMLKSSYPLGDSELRFKSAGPGGYWRGTLTEPECSLLVRPVGNFVAGSWETPQDEGYVLLELSDDGFDGWWWYSASTAFDGIWRSGEE